MRRLVLGWCVPKLADGLLCVGCLLGPLWCGAACSLVAEVRWRWWRCFFFVLDGESVDVVLIDAGGACSFGRRSCSMLVTRSLSDCTADSICWSTLPSAGWALLLFVFIVGV